MGKVLFRPDCHPRINHNELAGSLWCFHLYITKQVSLGLWRHVQNGNCSFLWDESGLTRSLSNAGFYPDGKRQIQALIIGAAMQAVLLLYLTCSESIGCHLIRKEKDFQSFLTVFQQQEHSNDIRIPWVHCVLLVFSLIERGRPISYSIHWFFRLPCSTMPPYLGVKHLGIQCSEPAKSLGSAKCSGKPNVVAIFRLSELQSRAVLQNGWLGHFQPEFKQAYDKSISRQESTECDPGTEEGAQCSHFHRRLQLSDLLCRFCRYCWSPEFRW